MYFAIFFSGICSTTDVAEQPPIIVCQITSKAKFDVLAVPLKARDFISGGLPVDSFIRPNKIFIADKTIILSVAGHLSETKTNDTLNKIIEIISP